MSDLEAAVKRLQWLASQTKTPERVAKDIDLVLHALAVNSHEALVAVCEEFIRVYDSCVAENRAVTLSGKVIDQARAALAKAKVSADHEAEIRRIKFRGR